jgi:mannose-6-phosphate isomerase-like protein (cupin superfamily)
MPDSKGSNGASEKSSTPVDESGVSLRVKPAVFLRLLDRLERPRVAHYKRHWGIHNYIAYCDGFAIKTSTYHALALPGTPHRLEKQPQLTAGRAGIGYPDGSDSPPTSSAAPLAGIRGKRRLVEFCTDDHYYVTEWWNSPEDSALSVARLRVEPGISTRAYRLRGVTERYLFLSGHGLIEIDGTNREVEPGDGLLIKAGSWRCITNMGERDLGLLSICRPRFKRMSHES